MDKQLIQSQVGLTRLMAIAIIIILVIGIGFLGLYWRKVSDPYIREVLSLEGNIDQGHDIFQINCAGCHNLQAGKSVGPNLTNISKRKSKVEIIEQVISGKTPPMPKFQPSYQEMSDLLSYLEQL
ncbi:MAG: c-type cytochrome [Pleurocapsa sp.]